MLSVPPRFRRDVQAMKDRSASLPSGRGDTKSSHTQSTSSSAAAAAGPSGAPDGHPTTTVGISHLAQVIGESTIFQSHPAVLLSEAPFKETTRHQLYDLHTVIQETSRTVVLEERRQRSTQELHALLRHIFEHYGDTSDILRRRATSKANPTVVVPSIPELMSALADEEMHFEVVSPTASREVMMQSLARQLQWLITQLGAAKERGELYEHQYKLLMLDYAEQRDALEAMTNRADQLERQLADKVQALGAERARAADEAKDAAAAMETLRGRVKDLMESNVSLMAGGGGFGAVPHAGGNRLPPLRHHGHGVGSKGKPTGSLSSRQASLAPGSGRAPHLQAGTTQSAAAPSTHIQLSTTETPPTASAAGSRAVTPRPSTSRCPDASQGDSTPRPSLAAAMTFDERERFLTTITTMKQELDAAFAAQQVAVETAAACEAKVASERERADVAERVGKMEVHAVKQLLQAVRDGHTQQLLGLEQQLAERSATCASLERSVDLLQRRLKESTARLLSLQNLLLTGPSVQTLLVSSASAVGTRKEAEETQAHLEDLSERISLFADEFSQLGPDDLAAIKQHMHEVLQHQHEGGEEGEKAAAAGSGSQPQLPSSEGGITTASGDSSPPDTHAGTPASTPATGATPAGSPTAPSAAAKSGSPLPAASRGRLLKKPTVKEVSCQTDEDERWMAGGAFAAHGTFHSIPQAESSKPSTPLLATRRPSAASNGQQPAAPGKQHRKMSATNVLAPPSAESIGVSVGGENADRSLSPLDETLVSTMGSVSASSGIFRGEEDGSPLVPVKTRSPKQGPQTQKQLTSSKSAPSLPKKASSSKLPAAKAKSTVASRGGVTGRDTDDASEVVTLVPLVDKAAAEEDEARRLAKQNELDAMKKAASQVQLRGVSLGDMSSESAAEISANLERTTALRKQISALTDQLYQTQQQLEQEKRAVADGEQRLSQQSKLHAKDAERIASLQKSVDQERQKAERMSERVSTLLNDVANTREELHELMDEKDRVETVLGDKIEELQRAIAKYKAIDARSSMVDRERKFLEVCERAIRCLMSAEATSSCSVCLSRMANPITIAPCGHACCEQCFLLAQSEHNVSIASEAYEAQQMIFRFRDALIKFHEDEETAQQEFLAGRLAAPPEPGRPPQPPTGYLTRAPFVKALIGVPMFCPECDKCSGQGYLQQTRMEELIARIGYVESVVKELQELGKQRYAETIQSSDPTAAIALETMTIADSSAKSTQLGYVDLELPPPSEDAADDDGG